MDAALRAQADADNLPALPSFFDEDGHLLALSDLNVEQRGAFDQWVSQGEVNDVIGPALNDFKLSKVDEVKDR